MQWTIFVEDHPHADSSDAGANTLPAFVGHGARGCQTLKLPDGTRKAQT